MSNYKDVNDIQEYYLYTNPETITLSNIVAYQEYELPKYPEQFAPVIVSGDNQLLNRCFFNKKDKFVFTKEENLEVKNNNCIYTTYKDLYNITTKDMDGNDLDFTLVEDNIIKIDKQIDKVNLKYEINNSFIINNNKISFNNNYDRVDIIIETDNYTPFYKVDEINLNPYVNKITEGFIFIDKKESVLADIKINISPKRIKAKKGQIANINIELIDNNNNPVSNTMVTVSVNNGQIKYVDGNDLTTSPVRTDIFGNVALLYTVTGEYTSDTITVSCIDKEKTQNVELFEVR